MNQLFDFSHFPTLDTERLRLREMTSQDEAALLKHLGDPEVVKYMAMRPIQTREQANEWLHRMRRYFSARDGLRWGITLKADQTFVGSAGLHNWDREARHAVIGYDIARQYWGKGYATEAVRTIIQFGVKRMRLNRIEANVVAGNHASMRVLEKLGFWHEGILRERIHKNGTYHDVHLFALLSR